MTLFEPLIKAAIVLKLSSMTERKGFIDFSTYLNKGGIFNRFNDVEFFKAFSVNEELGTLTWGEEIDIAPETLYANATGSGFPAWMKVEDSSSANKRVNLTP